MRHTTIFAAIAAIVMGIGAMASPNGGIWPDGSAMDEWFTAHDVVPEASGNVYKLPECGIYPDEGVTRTKEIQDVIDKVAKEGGGTVVVTPGVFRTGALFFKRGVHLRLMPGAVLLGSDDIADYPVVETRIEGQTCLYYPALVNADGCDGFTVSGGGTIDGNGLKAWRAFWQRRKWNRQCTNKDEQRPRLLYVSNSRDVRIDGVNLQNAMFWTAHFYRCERLKITNSRFYALAEPDGVKGPSTDGIDLDACRDVVVRGVWISNNDDAVCLKGGKGAFADDPKRHPGNGETANILVENSVIVAGAHSALTLGSESVWCRNVVFRDSRVEGCHNLLNLKMRTDTPQRYEGVLVEGVDGWVKSAFLLCMPWRQFADFEGRAPEEVASRADGVTMRECKVKCGTFIRTEPGGKVFSLSNFAFERLDIRAGRKDLHEDAFDGVKFTDVNLH